MQIREDTRRNLELVKQIWQKTDHRFPCNQNKIPSEQKARNEAYADQVSFEFHKQINRMPRIPFGRKKWCRETEAFLMDLLNHEPIIGIHNALPPREMGAFYHELTDFAKHARHFAPELTF